MSEVVPRPRVGREFFEDLYAGSEDPWGFATSDYEREKYADTLAALGDEHFPRALEVGCSIGVFTEQLAERCHELVGIDVSARALGRARERLRDRPGVRLERLTFPEETAPGPWDLVVCSEVLYYLDEDAFALAVERLRAGLEDGATVLAVHWRPATSTYPLRGDEVHDRLRAELGDWHAFDGRRPRYRLDRFEGR
ncbi:MAG TPA: SAM-dependent methyltransferase [Solirubrobacteraceae bacterium]|nr:SAM-dependent methyltransferase [Solirubrobacteraceae bacterium]